jgi:formylglycine-generating enzyme required for sulfatase activity
MMRSLLFLFAGFLATGCSEKIERTVQRDTVELDKGRPGKAVVFELNNGSQFRFRFCPPGNFVMGSSDSEPGRHPNENAAPVQISTGFWMGETEITQGQWNAVMKANFARFKGANLPVEMVKWEDALWFLESLNHRIVLPAPWQFALPTEAQWEYACRAGTQTPFSFGTNLLPEQANFDSRIERTRPAGSYPANPWGLFDMHGNVSEWCLGWYSQNLVGGIDPSGPQSGSLRVARGGSWGLEAAFCRSAARFSRSSHIRGSDLGFRIAIVQKLPTPASSSLKN